RCKRGAPWPLSDVDWVDEARGWGPKWTFGYFNSWQPDISVSVRCNNDIKLLTNGRDTGNITYYETNYVSKKQGRNYNASALFAKSPAFQMKDNAYLQDARKHNQIMLFRCIHAMNSKQEVAAPMVMMLLMGWGFTFSSHRYETIYWSGFVRYLLRSDNGLRLPNRCVNFVHHHGQIDNSQ
ncbi:uncharacterized protein LAESUDRAFT_667988, partial [Laetiporus sulphureus 93-53]